MKGLLFGLKLWRRFVLTVSAAELFQPVSPITLDCLSETKDLHVSKIAHGSIWQDACPQMDDIPIAPLCSTQKDSGPRHRIALGSLIIAYTAQIQNQSLQGALA
jgi:hypothetical protein